MPLPREVIVVVGGAVFVLALVIVIARRPTNRRLEALEQHPAGQLAPTGSLLREAGYAGMGRAAARLSRAWSTDEDADVLAATFAQGLAALGFEPTSERLLPGDVGPNDRLLLHMRSGGVRYALVLQPLPAKVGDLLITHGCRHVVRAVMEG